MKNNLLQSQNTHMEWFCWVNRIYKNKTTLLHIQTWNGKCLFTGETHS